MTGTQKQKICWNCEGRVSLEEENCPYCAVYLGPAPGKGDWDMLAPPYRIVDNQDEEGKGTVPPSPYTRETDGKNNEQDEAEAAAVRSEMQKVVYPLILLSGGAMGFLFGFVLLFFSQEGLFTLSWNANYWYVYLGAALPMLAGGWKALKRFEPPHG